MAAGLAMACAPGAVPGQVGQAQQSAAHPKILTVSVQKEPQSFGGFVGASSATAGGASNVERMLQDGLAAEVELDTYAPRMAGELPSLEKGTWRVNPDGTMETTWRLRPNVKWHDGQPFTSDDLVFAFGMRRDPEMARTPTADERLQSASSALDPSTYVVAWSETYVRANAITSGGLPRHLLGELAQRDKEAFRNSTYFTTDFVSTGPYRLIRWDQGSQFELARFDDYYRGRASFDQIFIRIIGDPNTMVASILAGQVDVVLPVGVDLAAALELKQRWAGTGNQVRADNSGRLRHLEFQFRPQYAHPSEVATSRAVRQALLQAVDREAMVEVMTQGLAPTADSWYPPTYGSRQELELSIPQFSYDPARARQLLADAGWAPGPDGPLVHQASNDRLEIEIWGNAGFGAEKEMNVVGDGWKAIGAQPVYSIIPAARIGDREYESTHPGVLITNPSGSVFEENRLHSREVTSPANRWTGKNRGGYVNPKVDTLLDGLLTTIDSKERLSLQRQLLVEQMGDVALAPLYWEVLPILMVQGVTGPKQVRNEATGNVFEWDKTE